MSQKLHACQHYQFSILWKQQSFIIHSLKGSGRQFGYKKYYFPKAKEQQDGKYPMNSIMNWKADWRVCYTAEKLIFSSIIFKGRKEARSKNISMGRKTFSIRAACLIHKFSICKCNKNINSFCIISQHNSQPLMSKATLERKKKIWKTNLSDVIIQNNIHALFSDYSLLSRQLK